MLSPSPVPSPSGLVVKNGSKIRSRTSAGCRSPRPRTSIRAVPFTAAVRTTTRPASFDASIALDSRFMITWLIFAG